MKKLTVVTIEEAIRLFYKRDEKRDFADWQLAKFIFDYIKEKGESST